VGRRPAPTSKSRLVRGGALFGAAVLAAGLSLTALPADAAPTSVEATAKKVATQEPGVTANLWEWNWTSIRSECGTLAKLGYDGVQVAPPQNSLKRTAGDAETPTIHPWWEVYQPVTYDLTSRMGNEAQFKSMVKACRKAGVKVYVDAVINHMTGQGSTSYGGQDYTTPYTYPDAGYVPSDFHVPKGECSSSDGGIQDFNSKNQVFKCNLVGLQDLDTDSAKVQRTLAAYLNKLIGYGVSGFRVDAGKHVGQHDLDDIYSRLDLTKDHKKPYWVLEVFGGGPGVLSPQAFTKSGDVLGLDAAKQIQAAFKSYPAEHVGSIATLEVFGKGSGLTASSKTMSFVTNHDTDRNAGEYLGHKDGARYILANEWLLAQGYGSPQIFSSFEWQLGADSPPDKSGTSGYIADTDCTNGKWTCDHRNPGIVGMIGWHHYVGHANRANWWTDGANVIAFSKGSRGWAAFNNGSAAKEIRVRTGLRAGRYCDVISGKKSGGSCTGDTIRVNRDGVARVTVGALSAVAVKRTDRLR
jgi:alpha-amylase